jgi:NAD(P) transhydrogenase subunit alpha
MPLNVCVPRESKAGERRVALVPDVVEKLAKAGFDVLVQSHAGAEAHLTDEAYADKGATIVPDAGTLLRQAEVVTKVGAPGSAEGVGDELEAIPEGAVLIGLLNPLIDHELVRRLASKRITSFALEAIPRTTRAQSMDALSSQSVIAGYRGALAAAEHLGKFFPMLITAAGTAAPSRVLVLGAGVAGLQAIATAKRLGAVVEAYDLRPAVKEEVESLGAKFVQIEMEQQGEGGSGQYAKELSEDQQRRQRELLAERVAAADCVITTAAVPGRPAPRLVTEEMVRSMRPGSVIVDLAAETGGNCALTQPGQVSVHDEVTIDGMLNRPSELPFHASLLYANNVANLLLYISNEGRVELDFEDEIVAGCCITHEGRIVNDRVREAIEGPSQAAPQARPEAAPERAPESAAPTSQPPPSQPPPGQEPPGQQTDRTPVP